MAGSLKSTLVSALPSNALQKPELPVVGVGASAGGLEAFTLFLRALPKETGMAFVLSPIG